MPGLPDRPLWQVRISSQRSVADGPSVEGVPPEGGGVWVGRRLVLTCAHVVGGPETPVMVRFSFAGGPAIEARVVDGGWVAEADGDLAVLEMAGDAPAGARPAPLRQARAVAGHTAGAYGYPAGHAGGVRSAPIIEGMVAGPAGGGEWFQLTARTGHGHAITKGFSGSGLWDDSVGAVVGLVVAKDRDPTVRGAYAVPLQHAVEAFPWLMPWVGWRLGTDAALRQHWRPRARGVYRDSTPGWSFTGRVPLLRELIGGWQRDSPSERLQVVTAQAGAGKSAVLAWLAALSDPQLCDEIGRHRPDALNDATLLPGLGRVSAAVWARGMDTGGVARALAAALALSVDQAPGSTESGVEEVLAAIGDLARDERGRLVVLVDALDEALEPARIARQLLRPLARDLRVRVLVGSRPGRKGELLSALGTAAVYRLDDPAYFDRDDLYNYVTASLRLEFDPDGDSGYCADPAATADVADAITKAAGGNFLVAGMAARARATEPVIDTHAAGWQSRQRFPRDAGEAFDDYLDRFGIERRRAVDLLRALAYAEGAGLPATDLWPALAGALNPPYRYLTDDLAWLLDSAAGYLVETDIATDRATYRLFHQALIDHLRHPDHEQPAQRRITDSLVATIRPDGGGPDWQRADSYLRSHLATHAAAGRLLDDLLDDPGYLLHAEPAALLRALPAAQGDSARSVARIYRQTAHRLRDLIPEQRASTLELAAHQIGQPALGHHIGNAAPHRTWRTTWAHPDRLPEHQVLTHEAAVIAVSVGQLSDGVQVIVSGDDNGRMRVWRLDDGTPIDEPWSIHRRPWGSSDQNKSVSSLSVGNSSDGTPVIVSGGVGPVGVRVWSLDDHSPIGEALAGSRGSETVALVKLADGTPVVVVSDEHGFVDVWRLDTHALIRTQRPGEWHRSKKVGRGHANADQTPAQPLTNGALVIVSSGFGGKSVARLDDVGRLEQVGPSRTGDTGSDPTQLAIGNLADGTPIFVSGGTDGAVRVCRLKTPDPIGEPLSGDGSEVTALAVGQLADGIPMVVSGDANGTVWMWRLDTPAPTGVQLRGHEGGVHTVAVATQADGTPVIVSGGADGTVRLWRLDDSASIDALSSDGGRVTAVAVAQTTRGVPTIVSGGADGTVRLWRLDDSASTGYPLSSDDGAVTALAVGESIDGTPMIVSGGRNVTARLWEDPTGHVREAWSRCEGAVKALAIGRLRDGTPRIIGACADGTVRVWSVNGGLLVHGNHGAVTGVAVGELANGTAVIVSSGADGTVQVRRLDDYAMVGKPRDQHAGLTAVAIGRLTDGTQMIVGGSTDGRLRMWRLDDYALVGEVLTGHHGGVTALAVANLADGTLMAVSSGSDETVRVWWLGGGLAPRTLHTCRKVTAVACTREGQIVIATSRGIVLATASKR